MKILLYLISILKLKSLHFFDLIIFPFLSDTEMYLLLMPILEIKLNNLKSTKYYKYILFIFIINF